MITTAIMTMTSLGGRKIGTKTRTDTQSLGNLKTRRDLTTHHSLQSLAIHTENIVMEGLALAAAAVEAAAAEVVAAAAVVVTK